MGQKLLWTAPRDAVLRRMRGEGRSWDEIGAELLVSRNAVTERGRRLGARLPPRVFVRKPVEDPDRPSLRPGHPITWNALVANTALEGLRYPVPPPMGRSIPGVIGEMC